MGQKIKISESELRKLIREAIEGAVGDNPTNPPSSENLTATAKNNAAVIRLKNAWLSRISGIGQELKVPNDHLQQILSLSPNVLSEYGIDQNKMNLLRQANTMLANAMGLINNFVSQ